MPRATAHSDLPPTGFLQDEANHHSETVRGKQPRRSVRTLLQTAYPRCHCLPAMGLYKRTNSPLGSLPLFPLSFLLTLCLCLSLGYSCPLSFSPHAYLLTPYNIISGIWYLIILSHCLMSYLIFIRKREGIQSGRGLLQRPWGNRTMVTPHSPWGVSV